MNVSNGKVRRRRVGLIAALVVELAAPIACAQPPGGWDQLAVRALVEAVVGDDPTRAELAASALGRRRPDVIEEALRSAVRVVGPTPRDLVMVEFDPRRAKMLDGVCDALARMGPRAVPELGRLVSQAGVESGLAAATLGQIGPAAASAAPTLVAALASKGLLASGAARNALPKLGPAAVPSLIAGLADANPDVRSGSAEVLGKLAADAGQSVPALTAALNDADPVVRDAAAKALPAFGTAARSAVAVLLDPKRGDEADDSDFGDALAHLVTDPATLRAALHSSAAPTSRRAALALGRMPPPAQRLLLEALGSPVPSVRSAALDGLIPATAGAAAAEPVARLLLDKSPDLRKRALTLLANLGRSAAAARPAIVTALGDPDPGVRSDALWALGEVAATPAEIAPALPLLRDPELPVRQAAAQALSRCPGGPSTLPILLGLLERPGMGGSVAAALGALGDARAVEPLAGLLHSPDPATRRAGADGLARLGPLASTAAEPLLGALQQETEPSGQCQFWMALSGIGPTAASALERARKLLGQENVAACEETLAQGRTAH